MISRLLRKFSLGFLTVAAMVLAAQAADAQISGVSATSDASNVYYQFNYTGSPSFFRLFFDTDKNASSGYSVNGIGADFMIENSSLYTYSGTGGSWGWNAVRSVARTKTKKTMKWRFAKTDLNSPSALNFFANVSPPNFNSAVYSQTLAAVSSPTPTPTPTPVVAASPTPTPPLVSSGPTYYVSPSGNDLNAGTSSAPWRTIQKAANSVSAGAMVIMMDGVYEEGQIQMQRGGTATAPITFKAQNKWMAVVSSISGCSPGISVYSSYITLQDLRVSVSPRNINCTVYTSANVHIRAWNSTVSTISNPTTGYVGFVARGIKLDVTSARAEGVKSNQDFTIIENSEIGHSVELFSSKDSVIRNNVITGQDRIGLSIFAKGGLRNARIYGNIIHNKAVNGTAILIGGNSCSTCHFDDSTGIEAYNVVAFNNVAINESTGGMAGLQFSGAKDSAFYNNIVINGFLAMAVGGQSGGIQPQTSNPTFKNNIVLCNGGSMTNGSFGWTYSGTLNLDYNNFYNCSSSIAQPHAVVGNPMFVNALSDWHLQAGSPAINAGIPVSMPAYGGGFLDISRDFNGIVRSSPWDLGIYEIAP